MANTCKYYKLQKYVSYDSGITWQPLDEYARGSLYEQDSTDCGGGITYYRWVELSSASTYYCDGYQKWTKEQKQQSTDNVNWTDVVPSEYRKGQTMIEAQSTDCGYTPPQYRWVATDGYYCDGTTKYNREKQQVSTDGGTTWTDTGSYRAGSTVIETESTDCGYVPPTPEQYRWAVNGTMCDECDYTTTPKMISTVISGDSFAVLTTDCDGSSAITRSDINGIIEFARAVLSISYVGSCISSISDNAYSGCTALQLVRLPSTITSIGDNAFYGSSGLTECSIPYGVTSIGNYAFYNCISLAYIDLPDTLTSIGTNVFQNCHNFRSVNIPPNITSIPASLFNNCDGLVDIELHSGITSIGDSAFTECSGLYTVIIYADTPPTLGSNVFDNTNANLKIYVPSGSVNTYKSASGWSTYANKIYSLNTYNNG